jgi:hypothetical protein
MFFSTVAIVTSSEMPTTLILVIYTVIYNLIEMETVLVTEVFWVGETASEVRLWMLYYCRVDAMMEEILSISFLEI